MLEFRLMQVVSCTVDRRFSESAIPMIRSVDSTFNALLMFECDYSVQLLNASSLRLSFGFKLSELTLGCRMEAAVFSTALPIRKNHGCEVEHALVRPVRADRYMPPPFSALKGP